MPFEFFDHTADIGARVNGATLPELFGNAAGALYAAFGHLQKSGAARPKTVELAAETLEDLLHDWLAELLFEVETRHTAFDEIEMVVTPPGQLKATVRGRSIDFSRSQPRAEVKAVTYHQLRVEQLPDGSWQATVIFDV